MIDLTAVVTEQRQFAARLADTALQIALLRPGQLRGTLPVKGSLRHAQPPSLTMY